MYLKQRPLFGIDNTKLSFSESSKSWLNYSEALDYAKQIGGNLPDLEELALLRVASFESKDQYNTEWRESWKYQATRSFALYSIREDKITLAIQDSTSLEKNMCLDSIKYGIDAHTNNLPWIITNDSVNLKKEPTFEKPENSIEILTLDQTKNNLLIKRVLRSATEPYTNMLNNLGIKEFYIHTPSQQYIFELLKDPNKTVVYSIGLGGDDTGINELILMQSLIFRTRAIAVMKYDSK